MPPKPSKSKLRQKRKQKRFEGLKRKLEHGPFSAHTIVLEPGGQVKMSEVILDFIHPYCEFATTEEAYRKLLTLAIIAWDASFLPPRDQKHMIEEVVKGAVPSDAKELKTDVKEIVNELIIRKKMYFSEYTRKIIDFELTDTGKQYHLSVVSTLGEGPL